MIIEHNIETYIKKVKGYHNRIKEYDGLLVFFDNIFDGTIYANKLEMIDDCVQEAYSINHENNLLGDSDDLTPIDKYLLSATVVKEPVCLDSVPPEYRGILQLSCENDFIEWVRETKKNFAEAIEEIDEIRDTFDCEVFENDDLLNQMDVLLSDIYDNEVSLDPATKSMTKVVENLRIMTEGFLYVARSLVDLTIFFDSEDRVADRQIFTASLKKYI